MKKGAKKAPEMTRIIAIDGSDILKHDITTCKNGKLYPDAFRGVLDESLDTLKMKEIFKRHKTELPFPYLEDKQFCRAVVNVSFAYAIKQFEQYGRRFVRYGCTVTDDEMTDHVCVRDSELIAIEVPYQKDTNMRRCRIRFRRNCSANILCTTVRQWHIAEAKRRFLLPSPARRYARSSIPRASTSMVCIMCAINAVPEQAVTGVACSLPNRFMQT